MADQEHDSRHGTSWIVTYCDMITVLIACFIMLITFGSKEQGNRSPRTDSILTGSGGSGVVGPEQPGADRDSLVWRILPVPGHTSDRGSELPPLYADPQPDGTPEVLRRLEADPSHTLGHSYEFPISLGLLFNDNGDLTPGGVQWLHTIGRRLRVLPYDILLQVNAASQLPQALKVARYFAIKEAIHPGRIGVGVRAAAQPGHTAVSMTFVRRPF
jgi:hypothetical protein